MGIGDDGEDRSGITIVRGLYEYPGFTPRATESRSCRGEEEGNEGRGCRERVGERILSSPHGFWLLTTDSRSACMQSRHGAPRTIGRAYY